MTPESDAETPIDITDIHNDTTVAGRTDAAAAEGYWRACLAREPRQGIAVGGLIEALLQQGKLADALELEPTLETLPARLDDAAAQRSLQRARALLMFARHVHEAGGIEHVRTESRAHGHGYDGRLRLLAASLAAIDGGLTNALEVFVELAGAPTVAAEVRIEARQAATALLEGCERGNIQIESLRRELERAS